MTALLTIEQERDLGERIRAGEVEARDELALRNRRWAIARAKHYWPRARGRLEFGDLVAEGTLGLVEAAGRFDPRRGIRFTTFATHWVDMRIRRACGRMTSPVTIPVNVVEMALSFRAGGERRPHSNCGPHLADAALDAMGRGVVRIGFERDAGEDHELSIPDPRGHARESLDLAWDAGEVLDSAPPTDRAVLELRFGLGGGEPLPWPEIADRLGITVERAQEAVARTRAAWTGSRVLPARLRPRNLYVRPARAAVTA